MAEAARPRRQPIPVSLLMGAAGAGKTTLLNRLLREPPFAGSAVILNEPGAVAIEGAVVERADDGIVALSGGCICCTVRGELVEALERLLRALDNGRIPSLRRVVIETAGLADPAPILFLLARHPYLSLRYRPDGIVTVVDARSSDAPDRHDEWLKQIAGADRIVLTPADRAGNVGLSSLRALNPAAPIIDPLAPADTFAGTFAPAPNGADILRWMGAESYSPAKAVSGPNGFSAFALFRDGRMPAAALYDFLDRLALEPGSRLVRLKGLIGLEEAEGPAVIHGVGGLFYPPVELTHWPDDDRRSRLTIIGKDVDRVALERLFDGFLGGGSDAPDRAALVANPLAIPGFIAR